MLNYLQAKDDKDFDRTYDSFAQFSLRDARALRRWRDEFRTIVREILIPEARSPPLPALRIW